MAQQVVRKILLVVSALQDGSRTLVRKANAIQRVC